jgi:dihydrofolate reductase
VAVGNVVAMLGMSLDGFIEGPNREIDWHRVDEELHHYLNDKVRSFGALLEGRRTYELMQEFWPTADQQPDATEVVVDFAGIWRDIPKYVYSTTMQGGLEGNATLVRDVQPEFVAELKEKYDGDLCVGGPTLLDTFRRLGLVDEYLIHVHPVVLGRGNPLFWPTDGLESLDLVETRVFGNGVVLLHYRVLDTPD